MRKILFLFIFILSYLFVPAQKYDTNDFSKYIKDVDVSKIYKKYTIDILGFVPIDSTTIEKAEKGDADSQYAVGIYYLEKERNPLIKLTVPNEGEDALKWFEKAALQGHKGASVEAGILYYERWKAFGFGHDDWLRRQAINSLKNGGAENDPNLMLYFAELILWNFNEQGLIKGSGKEALMWCNKAISMGLPIKGEKLKHRRKANFTLSDAYYIMALIFHLGTIDMPEDPEKYFANLKLAEKYSEVNNYPNGFARLRLGECYYLGLGVKQDQEKANEIWNSLIIDDESYKDDIKRIKGEYSENNEDKNQYIFKTEEDELREFLHR